MTESQEGLRQRVGGWVNRIRPSLGDNSLWGKIRERFKKIPKEWVVKWDKDIATLESLSNYGALKGYSCVVQGGYAVEAHCGGVITRKHADMDTVFYREDGQRFNQEETAQEVLSILSKENHTKWELHKEQDSHKIDIREVAPQKKWEDRRRLEISLVDYLVEDNSQPMVLYDSNGTTHTVRVESVDLLVKNKVRMMVDKAGQKSPRKTKQQDIDDLQRLIKQPHFDQKKALMRLAHYFTWRENLSTEESQRKASETWHKAFEIKVE